MLFIVVTVVIKNLESIRAGNYSRFAEALRSHGIVAAIDHEARAGYERGVVAEKEERGPSHLNGESHTAEHVVLPPDRIPLRPSTAIEVGGFVGFVRPNPARIHAVDADVVRSEIERLALGELADSTLRCVVCPASLMRGVGTNARDVDDGAAATHLHMRKYILDHAGESQRSGSEAAHPVLCRGIQCLCSESKCIVDEVIYPSVRRYGVRDDLLAYGFLGHVTNDERGVETCLSVSLKDRGGGWVAVAEEDAGAFFAEFFNNGPAYATPSTGNDGNFTRESFRDGMMGWDWSVHG